MTAATPLLSATAGMSSNTPLRAQTVTISDGLKRIGQVALRVIKGFAYFALLTLGVGIALGAGTFTVLSLMSGDFFIMPSILLPIGIAGAQMAIYGAKGLREVIKGQ